MRKKQDDENTKLQMVQETLRNEAALISSAIVSPGIVDRLPEISQTTFLDEMHGQVWALVSEWHKAGKLIDIVLFRSELLRRGVEINAVGLAKLFSGEFSHHYARYYADNVLEGASRRALEDIHHRLGRKLGSPAKLSAAIISELDELITGVRAIKQTNKRQTIGQIADTFFAGLDEPKPPRMATMGIVELDGCLGGLFAGHLTVVAARPGLGKTSLAMQAAMHNADKGRSVLFFSLEMPADELMVRIVSGLSIVPSKTIRRGNVERDERAALEAAKSRIQTIPLSINDRSNSTIEDIRGESRAHHVANGLDLIIIDYISLIAPSDKRMPRYEQVAEISRSLKSLAKELKVPVIALQQLNREAHGKKPELSHLRESGSIEQDADAVVLLHMDKKEMKNGCVPTLLFVAKNRHGETGRFNVRFDTAATRFME